MTNILQLPLIEVAVETQTNEDWIDAVQFRDDGQATIDISGIGFRMQLRPTVETIEVDLEASTENGRITIGGQGNSVLAFNIPMYVMQALPPRGDPDPYDFDVVATADGYARVVMRGTLKLARGVTR